MAYRLEDQAVAVRVGLSAWSGMVLPVLRSRTGADASGDCLVLGPETPEGAALHLLRPPRPWPQAPCTLRTPDGPRQAWRGLGRILAEFPAPLVRELTETEALGLNPAPWRITLDRGMLADTCPDLSTLLGWRMSGDLAAGLRAQGPLVRSWLDTGQELPSPLAAGAAASLCWRDHGRETRVRVRWPVSREAQEIRLRIGPAGIERLHLPLRVRRA